MESAKKKELDISTPECKYLGKIKIYADGADRNSMLELARNSLIQGLTTNPTLMRSAGVKDYRTFCIDILKQIREKPISFEIFADEFLQMEQQAHQIASWGQNVYVKVPITNSKGESSLPLIQSLSDEGIKLNVTAVFTPEQIKLAADALKNGPQSILSVFAGRIADAGYDPVPLLREAANYCESVSNKIELLWASTREAFNVIQAEQAGCHIITVPNDLIKKVSGFGKNLQQFSLETVQMFKNDAEAAGFSL